MGQKNAALDNSAVSFAFIAHYDVIFYLAFNINFSFCQLVILGGIYIKLATKRFAYGK